MNEKFEVGHYATPNDFANEVHLMLDKALNYYEEKEPKTKNLMMVFRLSLLIKDKISLMMFSYKHPQMEVESKFDTDLWIFP